MMNPNEWKTLNNNFKNLNATQAIKCSSFLKEVEDIVEAIRTEGVWIVSDGSYQK